MDKHQDLWSRLESIEAQADDDTSSGGDEVQPPVHDVWELTSFRVDPARYRPKAVDGIEIADVSKPGTSRYVLRNPETNRYLLCGEADRYIWELLDGKHTLKDLSLAYLEHFGTIGTRVIVSFLQQARSEGFLVERRKSLFRSLAERYAHRSLASRIIQAVQAFSGSSVTVRWADRVLGGIYRFGGWLFFTKAVGAINVLALSLAVGLFINRVLIRGDDVVLVPRSAQGVDIVDVIILQASIYFSILLHEIAHGVTVKHYGRSVHRAGFVIHAGVPSPFIDTTDMLMRSAEERMMVSAAGPAANGLVGCALFVAGWALGDMHLGSVLTSAAIVQVVFLMVNLAPLGLSDGHYIAEDLVGIPRLKARSADFVRKGVWNKIRQRSVWTRSEIVLLVYGIAAGAGSVILAWSAFGLWTSGLHRLLTAVLERPVFALEIAAALTAVGVFRALRRGWRPLKREEQVDMAGLVEDRLG